MNSNRNIAGFAVVLTMMFFLFQQTVFTQYDQQGTSGSRRDTSSQHSMGKSSSMTQEMGQVRTEIQKTSRSAGAALAAIRNAKSSKDTKMLQSALDKAEKELSAIQKNMANSMRIMNDTKGTGQTQGGGRMMEQRGKADGKDRMPTDTTSQMMEQRGKADGKDRTP